ncbi:MAG: HAD-IA family hydrolase [Methyloceanibacter sp.]|uniref:HAD-IA family hydrolase n=1 Tax=Methyloceanibacter sp. TaxID=1965321 RepID=UPI003D9B59EB
MDRAWPKAVVFDLDGTLVDTNADLTVALNVTLAELGLPEHPEHAVRKMVGGGLSLLLDRALAAHDVSLGEEAKVAMEARLFEHYAANPASLSRLYPHAAETLRDLQALGIACGICTNKPHAMSRDVLRAVGVLDVFACLQCGDSDLPKKPDARGLLRLVDALGAEPSSTFMVGDSITDVKTARAANLGAVVLVSYGYTAEPAAELGADLVIDRLDELPQAFAGLMPRKASFT